MQIVLPRHEGYSFFRLTAGRYDSFQSRRTPSFAAANLVGPRRVRSATPRLDQNFRVPLGRG